MQAFKDTIKNYFYKPSVMEAFAAYYTEKPILLNTIETASSDAIYRWDRLNTAGFYWVYEIGDLRRKLVRFKGFDSLVREDEKEQVTIDLSEVSLLSAAKDALSDAQNLETFSLNAQPEKRPSWLDEVTQVQLKNMMSHSNIGVSNSESNVIEPIDKLMRFSWHKGYALINGDGSHHLAAAKYIADRLPKKVSLSASFTDCELSLLSAKRIHRNYAIFVVPKNMDFCSTMIRYARAHKLSFGFLETSLTANIPGDFLILERNEANFKTIGEFLAEDYQELGQYLVELAKLSKN